MHELQLLLQSSFLNHINSSPLLLFLSPPTYLPFLSIHKFKNPIQPPNSLSKLPPFPLISSTLFVFSLHHCSDHRHYIVMVSIRRRRLLGLCSGRNSFVTPSPKFSENGDARENHLQHSKPDCVHPMPSDNGEHLEEKIDLGTGPGSSDSNLSKEQQTRQFPELKHRKRHRRKHSEHHELCLMRGVYFKNMKWQAAIKVDKKQIHLGTVGSQEEAARLYDRAAFMCGREPNFAISEEEKQDLKQIKWEDFLAITRSAITNKRPRKKKGPVPQSNYESGMLNNVSKLDHNADLSASEDA